MQMEKSKQIKRTSATDVVEIANPESVNSESSDNRLINVELELSQNVNRLMDRLEDNKELKHILTDRDQNKLISQKALDRLREKQTEKEEGFTPYDGTVENLLELAKNNNAIAEAIEINTDKMLEMFEKINYRYALIKEHPNNHDSLIHFVFGIPMPKINQKIEEEKTRIANLGINIFKKKEKYDENTLMTHKFNPNSLFEHSKDVAEVNGRDHEQVLYKESSVYFRTIHRYHNWPSFIVAKFDKFGKIKLLALTKEDKAELKLSGH